MEHGNESSLDEAGARVLVTTEAFDVAEWFKNNIQEDDFVALKVDIEGAEYEVLKQLIYSGAIDFVDWIAIEWHPEAVATYENGLWLKGMIDGYLARMIDDGKLLMSDWV